MNDRTESGKNSKNITANEIKATDVECHYHSGPEEIWKEKEFNLKLNNTRIKPKWLYLAY